MQSSGRAGTAISQSNEPTPLISSESGTGWKLAILPHTLEVVPRSHTTQLAYTTPEPALQTDDTSPRLAVTLLYRTRVDADAQHPSQAKALEPST